MLLVFVSLLMLASAWYYTVFHVLLRIERTYYTPNWNKDTKNIHWLRNSSRWVSLSDRKAYDKLARDWFFSTPGWARDNRRALVLIWCWRVGQVVIVFSLMGCFLGPLLIDALK
jgi:hypothetical protein